MRSEGRGQAGPREVRAPEAEADVIWKRRGGWSAHLFDGDNQVCSTQHGHLPGLHSREGLPEPKEPELGPRGIPYGRICAHCLKVFNRRAKP